MQSRRIRVIGKPRPQIDVDLLAQAILAIVEADARQESSGQGDNGDAA